MHSRSPRQTPSELSVLGSGDVTHTHSVHAMDRQNPAKPMVLVAMWIHRLKGAGCGGLPSQACDGGEINAFVKAAACAKARLLAHHHQHVHSGAGRRVCDGGGERPSLLHVQCRHTGHCILTHSNTIAAPLSVVMPCTRDPFIGQRRRETSHALHHPALRVAEFCRLRAGRDGLGTTILLLLLLHGGGCGRAGAWRLPTLHHAFSLVAHSPRAATERALADRLSDRFLEAAYR